MCPEPGDVDFLAVEVIVNGSVGANDHSLAIRFGTRADVRYGHGGADALQVLPRENAQHAETRGRAAIQPHSQTRSRDRQDALGP